LVHLRAMGATFPFALSYASSLAFFFEFFLLTFGIGMLLHTLLRSASLALR
jgi:hypothetical protein